MPVSARSLDDAANTPVLTLDFSPFRSGLSDHNAALRSFDECLSSGEGGLLRGRHKPLPYPATAPSIPVVRTAPKVIPCRVCGCTPDHPCDLSNGDECSRLTSNLCSGPKCARQLPRAKR